MQGRGKRELPDLAAPNPPSGFSLLARNRVARWLPSLCLCKVESIILFHEGDAQSRSEVQRSYPKNLHKHRLLWSALRIRMGSAGAPTGWPTYRSTIKGCSLFSLLVLQHLFVDTITDFSSFALFLSARENSLKPSSREKSWKHMTPVAPRSAIRHSVLIPRLDGGEYVFHGEC